MEKDNAVASSLNEYNEAKNYNNDYFMKPLAVNDRQGLFCAYGKIKLLFKSAAMAISTKNAYNTSIFPCITSFTIAYCRVYNISNRREKRYHLEKQLYMMLPYYILKYEQKTEETDGNIENEKEKAEAEDIMKNLLDRDLEAIEKELNRQVKKHIIKEYDKVLLLQLMWDVSDQALVKSTAMKGRVDEFMGGQVLEYAWETEYRRQLKEAEDEGELRGANRKIISQICRKLAKNKSVGMIAEELEEDDIEYIQHICEVAEKYAPDYDADRVYGELYPESENV